MAGAGVDELTRNGIRHRRQASFPIIYKGRTLGSRYQVDLLVAERVIVEVKSVETLLSVHEAQLLTYLRMASLRVGLLLNFNVPILRDGIIRKVL